MKQMLIVFVYTLKEGIRKKQRKITILKRVRYFYMQSAVEK